MTVLLPFRFEADGERTSQSFAAQKPAPLGKGSLFTPPSDEEGGKNLSLSQPAADSSLVRGSQLHSVSAVSVSAAKTSYPLSPSSFPNGTRCAGLPFGDTGNEALKGAGKRGRTRRVKCSGGDEPLSQLRCQLSLRRGAKGEALAASQKRNVGASIARPRKAAKHPQGRLMAAPVGVLLLPAETQRSHSFPLHYPPAQKLFQKSPCINSLFLV